MFDVFHIAFLIVFKNIHIYVISNLYKTEFKTVYNQFNIIHEYVLYICTKTRIYIKFFEVYQIEFRIIFLTTKIISLI